MSETIEKDIQTLDAKTVSVGAILADSRLTIPHYQRPYKWQQRHVAQLLEDIQHFNDRSAYRLGSLVLHQNEGSLEIVDGQQRTVTLALIIRAFINREQPAENLKLRQKLDQLKSKLFNPVLEHPLSRKNVSENYRFIEQRIHNLQEETILFLLEKCEFVQFTLHDLSSAFQFFDSQNARGKDLDPHDLLKAFHLRAFTGGDEEAKELAIQKWENTDAKKLTGLFQYYLFRIKSWGNHRSARFFTKSHVDLFKGIDIDKSPQWPFTQMMRMADVHTTAYNQELNRRLDSQKMKFPFQLEMPVVNGRLFFEMITHYLTQVEQMWESVKANIKQDSPGRDVIDTLENYPGRDRDGDKYIRQLFDAALLQYTDKFGYSEIDTVLCHLFVWAYRLRLEMQRVQLATMDNHAFDQGSYLHIIKNALHPKEVTATPYPMHIDRRYPPTEALQERMKKLLGDKIFENA